MHEGKLGLHDAMSALMHACRLLIAVLGSLVLAGCKPDNTAARKYRLVKEELGSLAVVSPGSEVSAVFAFPTDVQSGYFALVFEGVSVTNKNAVAELEQDLQRFRCRITLTEEDATSNVLYQGEYGVGQMTGAAGWHAPNASYVFSIAPFPILANQSACLDGDYPSGRNSTALRDGKILLGSAYRATIQVVAPASTLSSSSLWLDYVAPVATNRPPGGE